MYFKGKAGTDVDTQVAGLLGEKNVVVIYTERIATCLMQVATGAVLKTFCFVIVELHSGRFHRV